MVLTSFKPRALYIDKAVINLPQTQKVIQYFDELKPILIDDPSILKKPLPLTEAKKTLLVTKSQGQIVKACQGLGDYVCCDYYTVSFLSNCHFDCSYCILQDYLENNPVITFFANTPDIFAAIDQKLKKAQGTVRIGTGELADSLALNPVFHYAEELIEFAAKKSNLLIELKTKSDCVDEILNLNHNRKTVISFSINPQAYIDLEEHKCASLDQRLTAAKKLTDAGYPVAFHFDPLLALENWSHEYQKLVKQVASRIPKKQIAWVSMGSLRYTPKLKDQMLHRFPKSKLHAQELITGTDGKIRYFKPIRQKLYAHVQKLIQTHLSDVPHYLCMESQSIWQKAMGQVPQNKEDLETQILKNFAI